ncbi:MAG: Ig-like domain-containing protein, partial [Bacteroidota bacterium]
MDVHFLEPCSEVEVGFPLPGWVVTPGDGNILNITVNDYDITDPDLELVRVQWRRTNGDGAWINIAEVDKLDLGPVFEIVAWDIATLQDGLYEIRAVTQCFSGALNPGISHVITGKIERTAPEIFGTPEPADGVLSPNDEISITFTEPIRCDKIFNADVFANNNVGLYNTRTGNLVDAVVTCSGDKIIIVPNVANMFIENEILRVEVDSVEDLAGNKFGHVDWEFFVDRNAIRWLGTDIEEMVVEGNALTVTREIENVSGLAVAYAITGVPEWMEVLPLEGNLPPAASQDVVFKFAADLPRGDYLDTIILDGPLGNEPLIVSLRVLCESPQWAVDPTQFDYTMNFTVELDIEGELSEDNMDIVAALVGNEIRGVAHVEYEPAVDKYLAFLTVYSDVVSGETIDFQIWDANACLLYGDILESFPFALDGLVGSPLAPQTLHTSGLLLRNIPVHTGWNWLSFNLNVPDKSTGNVLSSLQNPAGGLVKSQTQFSQYHSGSSSWLGTLATLGYRSMYQYNAAAVDTIRLVGLKIDADTVNLAINSGWNWIPYLPNEALSPNDALASLTLANGDLVKSQTAFAQFVSGSGWIGNLDFLSAPNGYLLKVANPGVLTYPADDGFTSGGGASEQNGKPNSGEIESRGAGL